MDPSNLTRLTRYPTGVELFQDPSLLDAYIERLVSGVALEVLEGTSVRPSRDEPAYPNSVRGVKDLLESAFVSQYEIRDTGYGIRRSGVGVGRALIMGGAPKHVLLFASGAPAPEGVVGYTVPRSKMTRTLDEYEKRLEDLGPSGKTAVVRDLASIKAPEVTLFLLRQLKDTDTTVRRAVIHALGSTGDRRATEALVPLLQVIRSELTVYGEVVGALARLGDERVVDPMIKQIDVSTPEHSRIAAQALPDLLLQVKNRMLLNGAMGRLVVLYETVESAANQEGLIDPVVKGVASADAKALLAALRNSLNRITGLEFPTAASCRKWWNDRSARDQFLRERTGK